MRGDSQRCSERCTDNFFLWWRQSGSSSPQTNITGVVSNVEGLSDSYVKRLTLELWNGESQSFDETSVMGTSGLDSEGNRIVEKTQYGKWSLDPDEAIVAVRQEKRQNLDK